ncbi:MAG: TonB family protein [Rivularia sp. (in: cyanobacteria)]
MSFSNITIKQRNKEAKALKTFLIYSFIISLMLHIGIIASIIFKLLSKEAEIKEKPIEITFIDKPILEEVKPEAKPIKQEKPKLDTKEKPVEELKPNNQKSNILNDANSLNQNQTNSINLDNIPIPKATTNQQNIKQPPKTNNSNFKIPNKVKKTISKASVQQDSLKKATSQPPTPIPTKQTNAEVKQKPNKADNSQSIPENDTEAKKPRKTRKRLRTALKQSRTNRESPTKNTDEENVDTSLTEQPSLIQKNNNELKDKLSDIKENRENNPIPSEQASPTDINRKKRERVQNQTDSKVTRDNKKSELVSDLKQTSINRKLERVTEKPADTQTSQNIPNNDIESDIPETNSNIYSSNNNSINETTENPENDENQIDSNVTNPESVSTSPNPVTTNQIEDIKGNNNENNDVDTNIEKPNSNSTPLATSEIPKVEDNSVSGNAKVSSDGRADCRRCNVVYPKWAQRRKIQGRIVVTVDADAKGNVIPSSVRLVSSSGNSKLDEYHLKRAERWKLKPSENGRQGVTIGYEYILE